MRCAAVAVGALIAIAMMAGVVRSQSLSLFPICDVAAVNSFTKGCQITLPRAAEAGILNNNVNAKCLSNACKAQLAASSQLVKRCAALADTTNMIHSEFMCNSDPSNTYLCGTLLTAVENSDERDCAATTVDACNVKNKCRVRDGRCSYRFRANTLPAICNECLNHYSTTLEDTIEFFRAQVNISATNGPQAMLVVEQLAQRAVAIRREVAVVCQQHTNEYCDPLLTAIDANGTARYSKAAYDEICDYRSRTSGCVTQTAVVEQIWAKKEEAAALEVCKAAVTASGTPAPTPTPAPPPTPSPTTAAPPTPMPPAVIHTLSPGTPEPRSTLNDCTAKYNANLALIDAQTTDELKRCVGNSAGYCAVHFGDLIGNSTHLKCYQNATNFRNCTSECNAILSPMAVKWGCCTGYMHTRLSLTPLAACSGVSAYVTGAALSSTCEYTFPVGTAEYTRILTLNLLWSNVTTAVRRRDLPGDASAALEAALKDDLVVVLGILPSNLLYIKVSEDPSWQVTAPAGTGSATKVTFRFRSNDDTQARHAVDRFDRLARTRLELPVTDALVYSLRNSSRASGAAQLTIPSRWYETVLAAPRGVAAPSLLLIAATLLGAIAVIAV